MYENDLVSNNNVCVRLKYLKKNNYSRGVSFGLFKNVINKMCKQIIYIQYICIKKI